MKKEDIDLIPTVYSFFSDIPDRSQTVLSDVNKYYLSDVAILQESYIVYTNDNYMGVLFAFRDYGISNIFRIGFTLVLESNGIQYFTQRTYSSVTYENDNQFNIHLVDLPITPISACSLIINWISYGSVEIPIEQSFTKPQKSDIKSIRKIKKLRKNCVYAKGRHSSRKCDIPDDLLPYAWMSYDQLNVPFSEIIDLTKIIKRDHLNPDLQALSDNSEDEMLSIPINCYYDKGFYSTAYYVQNVPIIEMRLSGGKSAVQCIIRVPCSQIDMLMYLFYCTVEQRGYEIYMNHEQSVLKNYLDEHHPIMLLKSRLKKLTWSRYASDIVLKSSVYAEANSVVNDYYEMLQRTREHAYANMVRSKKTHGKWVNEFKLFTLIKAIFPDTEYQYSDVWLDHQVLDIYIPSIHCAVEYQGAQHYEAVDYFGGIEKLSEQKLMDQRKREKCEESNITLLEWPYLLEIRMPIVCEFFRKYAPKEILDEKRIVEQIGSFPATTLSDFFCRQHRSDKKCINEKKEPAFEIRKYNIQGTYICSYQSVMEAANIEGLSISGIQKAIYGDRHTAGGFQWKRCSTNSNRENIIPVPEVVGTNQSKRVFQVTMNGEVVGDFESINMAVKQTGINRKSISCALNGSQKTAGGYVWVYAE